MRLFRPMSRYVGAPERAVDEEPRA
jgi:hypothetical protein